MNNNITLIKEKIQKEEKNLIVTEDISEHLKEIIKIQETKIIHSNIAIDENLELHLVSAGTINTAEEIQQVCETIETSIYNKATHITLLLKFEQKDLSKEPIEIEFRKKPKFNSPKSEYISLEHPTNIFGIEIIFSTIELDDPRTEKLLNEILQADPDKNELDLEELKEFDYIGIREIFYQTEEEQKADILNSKDKRRYITPVDAQKAIFPIQPLYETGLVGIYDTEAEI